MVVKKFFTLLFVVVTIIGDINHVIGTHVVVGQSNAAILQILDNGQ